MPGQNIQYALTDPHSMPARPPEEGPAPTHEFENQDVLTYMRTKYPELESHEDQDIMTYAQQKYPELFHKGPEVKAEKPSYLGQVYRSLEDSLLPHDWKVTDILEGPKQVITHPVDTMNMIAGAAQVGMGHEAALADKYKAEGKGAKAALHRAASYVPVIGPPIADWFETGAEKGWTAPDAVGKTIALFGPEVLGETAGALVPTWDRPLTRSGEAARQVNELMGQVHQVGNARMAPRSATQVGTMIEKRMQAVEASVKAGSASAAVKAAYASDPELVKLLNDTISKNPGQVADLLFSSTLKNNPQRMANLRTLVGEWQWRGMQSVALQDFFNKFSSTTTPTKFSGSIGDALNKSERWSRLQEILPVDQFGKLQEIVKYAGDAGGFQKFLGIAEKAAYSGGVLAGTIPELAHVLTGGQALEGAAAAIAAGVLARVAARTEGMSVLQGLARAIARKDVKRISYYQTRVMEVTSRVMRENAESQVDHSDLDKKPTSRPIPPPPVVGFPEARRLGDFRDLIKKR